MDIIRYKLLKELCKIVLIVQHIIHWKSDFQVLSILLDKKFKIKTLEILFKEEHEHIKSVHSTTCHSEFFYFTLRFFLLCGFG